MNVRKSLISGVAVLGVSALLVTGAFAQQPPAGGGGGGRGQGRGQRGGQRGMMGMMSIGPSFAAINPTPDQQTKFQALQDKMRQDMMGLMSNQDMDPQERRTKMTEMSTKFQADVEALLTPEQKTKFAEEMKKRANGPLLMDALVPLKLTDEQKSKIEPIAKESQDALAKVMQDQSLQGRDRFDKMNQIREEFKGKIRPLLTPDQQSQLDTLNFNGGFGGRGGRRQGGNGAPPPSL